MGYYITEPSALALFNAGYPPDECVTSIYVPDEREIAQAKERQDRENYLEYARNREAYLKEGIRNAPY